MFDARKVSNNLRVLSWGLDVLFVDAQTVVNHLVQRLPMGTMGAAEFQMFLAETVSSFSSHHPDYSVLAGRVYTAYIHKKVPKRFSVWVKERADDSLLLFSDNLLDVVHAHEDDIDSAIMHFRDFDFTYHALRSMESTYFVKYCGESLERVQYLYMRAAIGIHGDDLDAVLDTYERLSTRKMSFASPILWNGGLRKRAFASCYIFDPVIGGSKDSINNFAGLSALWSADGGIGIHAGDLPATTANPGNSQPGLMTTLKVYDSLASYWSSFSSHRSSSATVYLPIWHCDVRNFVLCRTNRASSEYRFRHLFPALWVPDIFMRRLESDSVWSLFDPATVRQLINLAGVAFTTAYEAYERDGLAVATISARTLWGIVAAAQRECGAPFYVFSDNVNDRNNQKHMGNIKASNLCTEILQYSSPVETAVCVLGSLCLPHYVKSDGTFDYEELHKVTGALVEDLDRLVECTSFPTTDSAVCGFATRPLGIGVQGLADVFAMLGYPFNSLEARALNVRIFETVYHAALDSSCSLAERFGAYDRWDGSPAYHGRLQVDMWDVTPSDRYDFPSLRARINQFGLRNSVLTAQMPTAATALLLNSSEGVSPNPSNVVQHRVLSGNYNEFSRYLVRELTSRGLWSEHIRADVIASRGSVQNVAGIPDDIKAVFRTAFEIDPRDVMDMAIDRAPFIDQSQSLTLFVSEPTTTQLTDLALYAWKGGLKTGAYYVRSQPVVDPLPFGVKLPSTSSLIPITEEFPIPSYSDDAVCPCDV